MVNPSSFAGAIPLAAHDHWGWGPGPWIVVVVLAWAAIIVAVIWLLRQTGARRDAGSDGSVSAAEILDRRFAEGRISAEEYRQRREILGQTDR
jgi:putative membrane protein